MRAIESTSQLTPDRASRRATKLQNMSTEKELMWVHALAIVVTAVVSTDGETGGCWDTRGDTEIAPQ